MKSFISTLAMLLFVSTTVSAQPYPGNTLITPVRSTETFLIDIHTNTIQNWHGDNGAGHTVYLLPDFSVLRSQGDPNGQISGGGGAGGQLQRVDDNGNIVWDYFFSNSEYQQHHDIQPMPNGNVLVIAWEEKLAAEAVAYGREAPFGERLLPTLIAELEPVGANDANIVWEWRIWDHIIQDNDPAKPNHGVIAEHPELIDIDLGGGGASWDHANFIDYNPHLDQIVFSTRAMNEVYIIDHGLTTEEAAGHTGGRYGKGGDILYRWGNPQNYGAGTEADQRFFGVHGANWIDRGLPGEGGILAFNNGNHEGDDNDASTVVEFYPPFDVDGDYILNPGEAYGPDEPVWEYSSGPSFYSLRYGSAFRLPNGNTLVCEGFEGLIFELDENDNRVWVYLEPIGRGVFSAERYYDPVPLMVDLDIYPDDCPNTINLTPFAVGNQHPNKGGVVPVAIYSTLFFGAHEVDPSTVQLGGVSPLRHGYEDVGHGNGGESCGCSANTPDGRDDLTFKFQKSELAATLASAADGDMVELELTGLLYDGTEITASECVYVKTKDDDDGPNVMTRAPRSRLTAASPNPFNPVTRIGYSVANDSEVRLDVFDVQGRHVATLVNGRMSAGDHTVTWDARGVASGIYFYRMTTADFSRTRKMILLK